VSARLRAREKAERRGRLGEALAALWLQLKGYAVLAARVRTPLGELDLVVRRGKTLAFVEVKTRRRKDQGLEAISFDSHERIAAAAEWWLSARPALAALDLRYDLVVIAPWSAPLHMRDAWRPDDNWRGDRW
jgi:putative endonuclease